MALQIAVEDFRIDIAHEQSFKYLQSKQYDNNSRIRRLIITQNNVPIQFTGKELITLALSYNGDNYSNTTCKFGEDGYPYVTFTESMLSKVGDVECELKIYDSDTSTVVTTFTFMMTIRKSLLDHDKLVKSSEFNVLNDLILQALEIPDLIEDFEQSQTELDGYIEEVNKDIDNYQKEYTTLKNEINVFIDDSTEWYENAQAAEDQRAKNETARQSAEKSRVNAEKARVTAESQRASAESTRNTNENARKSAETARANAEGKRVTAENTRVSNENKRISAENDRVEAENDRKTAETNRDNAENTRKSAESGRVNAENTRVEAEKARASAETARANAEKTRQSNETTRQNQEAKRQEDTAEAIDSCNTATVAANEAVEQVRIALENWEFVLIDCNGGVASTAMDEYENDYNGGGA